MPKMWLTVIELLYVLFYNYVWWNGHIYLLCGTTLPAWRVASPTAAFGGYIHDTSISEPTVTVLLTHGILAGNTRLNSLEGKLTFL